MSTVRTERCMRVHASYKARGSASIEAHLQNKQRHSEQGQFPIADDTVKDAWVYALVLICKHDTPRRTQ